MNKHHWEKWNGDLMIESSMVKVFTNTMQNLALNNLVDLRS